MSEEYTGRTSAMRTSQWLASEDLDGLGEVEVVIESVHVHKDVQFDAGRKQPKVYAVKFVGKDRQMILNATNRKAIVSKYGTDVKLWKGQKVKLFVKDGVRSPSGGTTKGIRVAA